MLLLPFQQRLRTHHRQYLSYVAVTRDTRLIPRAQINEPPSHRLPATYLPVQRGIHVPGSDGVDPDAVRGPLRGEGFGQLGHGRFGGVVGALLLRVQDAGAGDGGEEDDGAAGFGGDHVLITGFRGQSCLVQRASREPGIIF